MKFDSYTRFLKSPLYQECILAEVEGRSLPDPQQVPSSPASKHSVSSDHSNVSTPKKVPPALLVSSDESCSVGSELCRVRDGAAGGSSCCLWLAGRTRAALQSSQHILAAPRRLSTAFCAVFQ